MLLPAPLQYEHLTRAASSGGEVQASGRSVLDGHVAGVSLLAADDLHHVRQQQWIALLVEFKRPAHAFEADPSERISDGGAIFLPSLLDGQQRKRDRVIGFGRIGVRHSPIRLLILLDEHLRCWDIGSGSNAKMGGEVDAVDRRSSQLNILRRCNPVRAETHQVHPGLDILLRDQRTLGIARPLNQRLRRACLDAAERRREFDVPARVALICDYLEPVFLTCRLEGFEAAAPEIVIDIQERELLQVRKFVMDKIGQVSNQLRVRYGRPEYPLVTLRSYALRGA